MTKKFQVRIGSRGSALARAQAYEVQTQLMEFYKLPEKCFPIEIISTSGDNSLAQENLTITQKGSFTKEIEEALLEKKIDIAVHSAKDVPTILHEDLQITAFLKREDPRDAFIGKEFLSIKELPKGGTIGSSSFRRRALIKRMRADLNVIALRGNVDTRLHKLEQGKANGIVLALAGLKRLGLAYRVSEILNLETFPPPPGQGAICLECRSDDKKIIELLTPINHKPTEDALLCERSFLYTLEGSCRAPIAGYAKIENEQIMFSGLFIGQDEISYTTQQNGSREKAPEIGRLAAEHIRKQIGYEPFKRWQEI